MCVSLDFIFADDATITRVKMMAACRKVKRVAARCECITAV